MKTQINNLRSGTKNQVINPAITYNNTATSHVGHSGSKLEEVNEVWKKVIAENPESMTAIINGVKVEMKANWSRSRLSVSYFASITNEDLVRFGVSPSKKDFPSISINCGNCISVNNGKNGHTYVCPSLVTIL